MPRVVSVKAADGHRLHVEFDDGVRGSLDLSDRLFGPLFAPLADRELFSRVGIDDFGAVCWPNGADLAPDAVYATIRSQAAR